jgi:HAD superfamily hydrolase (TIGR01458 family)
MADLPGVELALLDLDGTVYVGTRPLPGAVEAVTKLRELGMTVRFVTNTDSVTPDALVERLSGMGIAVSADELLTPVVLARQLLSELPAARLLAVASSGIRELLAEFLAAAGEQPTHVLICDPSYGANYAELDAAFHAVRGGAELLATQVARIARRDDGEHLDTGGFVRLLEYATARQARVLGKPSHDFFRLALDAAGVSPEHAVMVGDDLAADIAGAQQLGIRAVLVRTGKAADPDPQPAPSSSARRPTAPGGAPTGPDSEAEAATVSPRPDWTINGPRRPPRPAPVAGRHEHIGTCRMRGTTAGCLSLPRCAAHHIAHR